MVLWQNLGLKIKLKYFNLVLDCFSLDFHRKVSNFLYTRFVQRDAGELKGQEVYAAFILFSYCCLYCLILHRNIICLPFPFVSPSEIKPHKQKSHLSFQWKVKHEWSNNLTQQKSQSAFTATEAYLIK